MAIYGYIYINYTNENLKNHVPMCGEFQLITIYHKQSLINIKITIILGKNGGFRSNLIPKNEWQTNCINK